MREIKRKKDTGEAGNGGQFGTTHREEADVEIGSETSRFDRLMQTDPPEFDGELAEVLRAIGRMQSGRDMVLGSIHRGVGDTQKRDRSWGLTHEEALDAARSSDSAEVQRGLIRLARIEAQMEDLRAQRDDFEGAFAARGGWSRAFLVSGNNGHVHSSTACSTLRPTTNISWMTDYSGHSDDQIVADAGHRACTVCYPDAPVGNESTLPSRMYTPEEIQSQREKEDRARRKQMTPAERRKEDRERKRAKEIADSIDGKGGSVAFEPTTLPDGRVYEVRPVTSEYEAQREWNRGLTKIEDVDRYGIRDENYEAEFAAALAHRVQIARALAAKHGTSVIEQKRRLDQRSLENGYAVDDDEAFI